VSGEGFLSREGWNLARGGRLCGRSVLPATQVAEIAGPLATILARVLSQRNREGEPFELAQNAPMPAATIARTAISQSSMKVSSGCDCCGWPEHIRLNQPRR
jgi:hypothetical protein